MDKYKILCFSATGNSLFLAKRLASKLDCEIIVNDNKVDCDHLIIIASIHAFRIPSFLIRRIGNVKNLSVICVGCNDSSINSAAGIKYINYCKKNNIELGVYKILSMPLTIVKKFDKELGSKIIKESLEKIDLIYKDISNNKKSIIKIPFSSRLFGFIHYIESFMVKLFGLELYANKDCIKCGICERDCPKNNIKICKKVKFGINCMLCMKCIYKCPKNAIHPRFSKFIELNDGYYLDDYLDKK